LHHLCSSIQGILGLIVVLCSLEQEGCTTVLLLGKCCHQRLAFSGFMVLSRQLGTLKKTRLDHDISDLQVGALERGPSSRTGIPSWLTIQFFFCRIDSMVNVFNIFWAMVLKCLSFSVWIRDL
jgi:hypothetical protein